MTGFIISVRSNNPIWYLIGTIVFTLIGIGLSIVGFTTSAGVGTGIFGIVMALAAIVLMIGAIRNLSS